MERARCLRRPALVFRPSSLGDGFALQSEELRAVPEGLNFSGPLLALGGKLGQRLVIVHDYASTT